MNVKGFNVAAFLKERKVRTEDHGDELGVPCPDCDEGRKTDLRLWFNTKKLVGKCYKCETAYDAPKLVMAVEGCGYADALRLLKENGAGGQKVTLSVLQKRVQEALAGSQDDEEDPRQGLAAIDLPASFVGASGRSRRPEFIDRVIRSEKVIAEYGIGWCGSGYYRGRMIVPIRMDGEVVSFWARDMTGKADRKVLYPKGSHVGRMLFNYDRARQFEHVVLVEGVSDALRGGPSYVALLGSKLTRHQLALLLASNAREVTIMLDGDEAGIEGAKKAADALRTFYRRIRVVTLPRGHDPKTYERAELREIIARTPCTGRADLAAHVRALLG